MWILPDGSDSPTPVKVGIGESDGRNTALTESSLAVGARVITDTINPAGGNRGGFVPRGPHG